MMKAMKSVKNLYNTFADWYFTKRALPYWCVLALDCLAVLFAGVVGTYMDRGGLWPVEYGWHAVLGLVCTLPFYCLFFHLFHTYLGIMRFSSYVDLCRIVLAMLLGSVCVALVGVLVTPSFVLLPSVQCVTVIFVVGTFLIWIVRLLAKAAFESFRTDKAVPVAIYGTQAGGIAIANSIRSVKEKKYVLRAFISDRPERKGIFLLGCKVFINGEGIADRLKARGVEALLVSPMKSESFCGNVQMVDALIRAGIRIMMMPAATEWDGKSQMSFNLLHEVEIEDLLPRDKIEIDMEAVGGILRGRRILITGAAGSIGAEMVRQVAQFEPAELVLIDQAETPMHDLRLMMARRYPEVKALTLVGSITDRDYMESVFAAHRPEFVFHAAAYKHVPMMEDSPVQAVRNNIRGTRIIADLAVQYGTEKFVMISTDKAVNPTNVMGCSKRICEIYCQSLNRAIADGQVEGRTQFVTTRFGNVLGSSGSVIPLFREQIRRGGPVTVTHPDIIRYFMLIPEACRLVLEAGAMGRGGEIFVFDMGKPVKIVDLARRMIQLSGATNVEVEFTGLRDGEKLYEEVLNDAECTIPTRHPKILRAKVREYDYTTACRHEDELLRLTLTHDDMAIVAKMKEIVPEYKSQHSRFETLDHTGNN